MDLSQLAGLIDAYRNTSVEFGTPDNAPSDEWIRKAEAYLGLQFPKSYIWFLKNYGGGEIHGDEIFSIYQLPFDEVVGGDVVCRTMQDRKNGLIEKKEISICRTDFGELFVIDTSQPSDDGEYQIVKRTGNERDSFVPSFAAFIEKFIGDDAIS